MSPATSGRTKGFGIIADMSDTMAQAKTCSITTLKNRKNGKPVTAFISLYCYESLATRYLGSAVRSAGYDCLEIYYEDMKRNYFKYPEPDELKSLIDLLRDKGVDIVGISVRSSYRKLAAMITDRIHQELSLPVIWGSTHATICPDDSIIDADVVCRGEGEAVIVELLDGIAQGKDVTAIKGLWFKLPDGSIRRNEVAPYPNLDRISDPQFNAANKYYMRDSKWHDGDPQWTEGAFTIISSRGCPHLCTFCTNPYYLKAQPGYLRLRSVDRVIAEIKQAVRQMPNIRRVKFYDDLFATNKKWTDEFVEKYRREVTLPFDALLNPQHVTKSLISKLTYAGLSLAEMGIQNGSERMSNEVYDRRLTNEKLTKAVTILNESGIRVHYDLIIDNPLETHRDKQANFEFLLTIPRPYSLFILSLTHFPGTPLTERLLKEGRITEAEVEGRTDKTLFQWEVSLNHKRKPEDSYWLALMSLLTKDFVPKGLIRFFYRRKILMRYPAPLVAFAWLMNAIKMTWLAGVMYREGSLTMQVIRRHANLKQLPIK